MSRIVKGLKSINRLGEVAKCIKTCHSPISITTRYVFKYPDTYPQMIRMRHGYHFQVNSWEDLTTAWVVLTGGEYRIHQSDRKIIDLGANLGIFCLYALSISPDAEILAVEASPTTYQFLKNTLQGNQLQDKVTPINCAASGVSGTVTFNDDQSVPSHSRSISDGPGTIQIPAKTLSELADHWAGSEVDYLKIDIEGAEYDLLTQTDMDTLRRFKKIGFEYHSNGNPQMIWDKLDKADFKCTFHPKTGHSGVAEFTRQ